jgi:hypothetical protein
MESPAANTVMTRWHDLTSRTQGFQHAFNPLNQAVKGLIPDDGVTAGVAVVDGVPTIVALTGESVLTAHVELTIEEEHPPVILRRLPVVADQVTIELAEELNGELASGEPAHIRRWKFSWPSGQCIEFAAVVKVYDGWHNEPDLAEEFARALAAAVGWTAPGFAR